MEGHRHHALVGAGVRARGGEHACSQLLALEPVEHSGEIRIAEERPDSLGWLSDEEFELLDLDVVGREQFLPAVCAQCARVGGERQRLGERELEAYFRAVQAASREPELTLRHVDAGDSSLSRRRTPGRARRSDASVRALPRLHARRAHRTSFDRPPMSGART